MAKFRILAGSFETGYHEHYLTEAEQAALLVGGSRGFIAIHNRPCAKETDMPPTGKPPTGKRLSKHHIDLLRGNVVPGRREIDVTPAEMTSMLDEIEYYRAEVLDVPDVESRTRTIPTADAALALYKAMIDANIANLPDLEEGALWTYPLALGFFLGLGLALDTARHLAVRV